MKSKTLYFLLSVYIAANGFFNPFGLLSPQVTKFLFYGISLLAVLLAFRKKNKPLYPKWPYRILILGIVSSSVVANTIQGQSFSVSFVAMLQYIFSYLYLYVLMKYRPSEDFIEKAFKVLTLCSLVMYLVNLASFPNMVFGETKDEYDMSRGFVRIGMPMIEIVVTYFFYNINKWITTRDKKTVYWIILTMAMIFMSLTRQVIALSAALGLLFIMQKASWVKKGVVILSCVFIVYVVLPQIPMVKTMMELSKDQASSNEDDDDIRVKAWRFYTQEYQTNEITPIVGNGVPGIGNSPWGNRVGQALEYTHCLLVDVGWAGFFWLFGGITTLALLLLLLKAIFMKKRSDRQYLTYSVAFVTITSVASAPILYYSQVCGLSLILYMAYASKENRNTHPQLQ